jgi:hypothetical protein
MGGSGISVMNRSEDKKTTIRAIEEEEKADSSTKTGSTAAASVKEGTDELQLDFEIEDIPMEGADN